MFQADERTHSGTGQSNERKREKAENSKISHQMLIKSDTYEYES